MIKLELPEALYPVFSGEARYRVAHGGRGSAKSWGFARMAALRAYEKPRRILCARELQNSIKDSVHTLLSDQIEAIGLPGFEIGESFIRHQNGSEFIFKGLRSNAKEIKSMEGVDICWVEEAQAVSDDSWQILIPTIRKPGSEIWVTFNPLNKDDPTSLRFIESPPPNSAIVEVNYDQNPWLPKELLDEALYLKSIDLEEYEHVWLGKYRSLNKGGRVVPGWSFANVDHIPYDPNQKIYLTCDFNVDPMCWALAHRPNRYEFHFFDEIVRENTNIISTVETFVTRYGEHKAGIVITGDASGKSRTDGTPEPNQTRYALMLKTLSDFGVVNCAVDAPRSNPQKKSRYEIFNSFVCDHKGVRRVKVDPKCKQIINNCEHLKFIPGSGEIWQPTPKQIEDKPAMKFQRQDMYDAISYLVNRYNLRVEPVDDGRGPKMTFQRYEK